MFPSPSLADLQLLRLIQSEGGYRGAARLLGIAHTTIQRRIQRLEQTLGIPLIQRSVGRMELTPWTTRLIEQLNHQLDGVSETIKAAQNELTEVTIITIDEALLDIFPVLFTALETFKYSYASWMVRPTQGADAMIQLAASPSRFDGSAEEFCLTWGVFAHRTLRYDHHLRNDFQNRTGATDRQFTCRTVFIGDHDCELPSSSATHSPQARPWTHPVVCGGKESTIGGSQCRG